MTDIQRWSAVLKRERNASFVYAVVTTRVYCRPSCPSRRPKPDNVRYFDSPGAAEEAGFRACRRCEPAKIEPRAGLVADLCRYIEANRDRTVHLQDLSEFAGLSPFHSQRVFRSEAGVSPLQYQRALREWEAGPGDLVTYGFFESPLGRGLIAETRRGVCAVTFGKKDDELLTWLKAEMPYATLTPGEVSSAVAGLLQMIATGSSDLPLDIRGTAFQQKVWKALRAVPAGQTTTYSELAAAAGSKAVRATGSACGANRIAVLIPCHRAVRTDGGLGGYRWGLGLKQELLRRERT